MTNRSPNSLKHTQKTRTLTNEVVQTTNMWLKLRYSRNIENTEPTNKASPSMHLGWSRDR